MKYGFSLVAIALFTMGAHAQDLGSIINSANILHGAFDPLSTRTILVKTVGPTMKTYSARVPNCAKSITHVRVKVSRADLTIDGGGAIFSDGTSKTAQIQQTFNAGYVSPWIALSFLVEPGKCPMKVFVNAQSAETGLNSQVEVQARYTN